MMFMPYMFFFLMTLVLGSIMSVSSGNWVYVWMGLEMNLLSFIPLIVSSVNDSETESALKYFLVQALGSSFILFSAFSISNYPNSMISCSMSYMMLIVSMMVKMGMAPFHFWLPHVMGGISWFSCMLLAVWQKLAPLMLLSSMIKIEYLSVFMLIGGFGSLIGGVGGMNQSQMRVLLAYSSIGHMGWMLVAMCSSFYVLIVYYFIYSTITISIMMMMVVSPMKMVNLSNFSSLPMYVIVFMGVLFMSLGGLPPFLGFYPKMLVLMEIGYHGLYLSLFMLILGSLMNIFYYLNIFFNLVLKSIFYGLSNISMKGGSLKLFSVVSMTMMGSITMGLAVLI